MVHVRGVPRLTLLVRLVGEEAGAQDICRDLVLARHSIGRTPTVRVKRSKKADRDIPAAAASSETVHARPAPQCLLAWRMAVAKDLLRSGPIALDEVARRVGYGSSSTFSTAFSRHVRQAPGRFMRAATADLPPGPSRRATALPETLPFG